MFILVPTNSQPLNKINIVYGYLCVYVFMIICIYECVCVCVCVTLEESGLSCWGVRGPALLLFLFYVNISGMPLGLACTTNL